MQPASQSPDEHASVKKLLALKRHEEPPPGYFDRLPGEIRARIARAAANPEPGWRRWLESWELSPALATGYAAVAGALVLGGVWLSQRPGPAGQPQVATAPVPTDTNQANTLIASNAAPPGLFNPPTLQVQPAEFKR